MPGNPAESLYMVIYLESSLFLLLQSFMRGNEYAYPFWSDTRLAPSFRPQEAFHQAAKQQGGDLSTKGWHSTPAESKARRQKPCPVGAEVCWLWSQYVVKLAVMRFQCFCIFFFFGEETISFLMATCYRSSTKYPLQSLKLGWYRANIVH